MQNSTKVFIGMLAAFAVGALAIVIALIAAGDVDRAMTIVMSAGGFMAAMIGVTAFGVAVRFLVDNS